MATTFIFKVDFTQVVTGGEDYLYRSAKERVCISSNTGLQDAGLDQAKIYLLTFYFRLIFFTNSNLCVKLRYGEVTRNS